MRSAAIWLIGAVSSIVLLEPAPYDVLITFFAVIFFARGLRIPPGLEMALLLLGLFMVFNTIASLFAPNPMKAIAFMAITIFLLVSWLFFTAVIYEDPARYLRAIWHGYTIAAVIAVALGIVGYFRLISGYELFQLFGRAKGAFKDPNVFGPFLVPVFMYLVLKVETGLNRNRMLILPVLLFVAFGVLLSFSRGAWLNVAVSISVYVGLRVLVARSAMQLSRLAVLSAIAVGVVASSLLWAILNTQIGEVFIMRATLFQRYDVGADGRFSIILEALRLSLETPFGIGPGQSGMFFPVDPHNLYVHVLLETGWLGAVTFFGFILLTLWKAFGFCFRAGELQNTYIVIFACVVGALLESMIIHSTHWRHLYLLLAMLWGPMLAGEKARRLGGPITPESRGKWRLASSTMMTRH